MRDIQHVKHEGDAHSLPWCLDAALHPTSRVGMQAGEVAHWNTSVAPALEISDNQLASLVKEATAKDHQGEQNPLRGPFGDLLRNLPFESQAYYCATMKCCVKAQFR